MKTSRITPSLACAAALALWTTQSARAATQVKADNNNNLNLGSSWVSGTAPGWAVWDGTYTPANCTNTLGATVYWNGISISNVIGAPIQIIPGGSYTLGLTGIGGGGGVVLDMGGGAVDLNIRCNMSMNQNVATTPTIFTSQAGRTLTISGSNLYGHGSSSQIAVGGAGNCVISALISQLGTLVKNGSGALTLSHANYITNMTLNAGTLNLNQAFAINGSAGTTFIINGGTIDNTSGAPIGLTANAPLNFWNGDFTFAGTTNLNLGAGAVTLSGNRQVTVNNNTLTVGGAIGDGGTAYSLTKAGAGALVLSGVSTYTGNTVVSGGILALSGSGSLSSSKILVGNGGTFDVSAAGWSGNGSQALGAAGTSGIGTITNGSQTINLNYGDGLSFQAAGGGSPTVGSVNVAGALGSVNLNGNNTVTINVTGSPLGASTNTLLTVSGTLNGAPNPVPAFSGVGLASGCGAAVVTTAGSGGSLVLVVTNKPQAGESTTTLVARTTGVSPQIYGGQLDFTATVTGTATAPGGNVIFKDGATVLATLALSPATGLASIATYTSYTDLKVAGSPHSITAYYQGDDTHMFSDSSASPVSQSITPKALTYSGLTADSATYDGTTVAKLGGTPALQMAEAPGTGTTADGIPYTVDSVGVGGTAAGTLAAKDVGNQAVTVSGVTLVGAGAGNYTLLQQSGLVQTVTPKALTVTGLAVTNKLYDGTTAAGFTTNSAATLQGAEAAGTGTTADGKPYTGDSVSLIGTPVATFAIPDISNNIPVNVSGLTLTGATTNDYFLREPVLSASILGLHPGDQLRADNNNTLSAGAAWVSNTIPQGNNWAIYTGPYNSTTLADTLGASLTLGGIMISNVTGSAASGAGVVISGDANSFLTLGGMGGKGVEMSAATVDLTLALARMCLTNDVAFNVPAGRTFTWADTVSPSAFNLNNLFGGGNNASHNLTLNGDGNFVFNGNMYDDPGNAVLTFNGNGTYTLQGANYVTKYVLNAGTLNFGNASAVRGSVTINGGAVDCSTGMAMTLNTNPRFNWNGDFSFGGSADLNLGSGAVTLGGNRRVTVNSSTLTVGGVIDDNGQRYSLTKAGYGTLKLSGANTYSGNTTVEAGTLVFTRAALAGNSTVTVAGGAILQLDFTGTNTVANLVLGGVSQPAGVYDSTTGAGYLAGAGSLLVLGSVTPTATNLTCSLGSGRQLILNWPAGQGWNLQSNSVSVASSNAWHTVTGATPPYSITINPANPEVFFRLTYP